MFHKAFGAAGRFLRKSPPNPPGGSDGAEDALFPLSWSRFLGLLPWRVSRVSRVSPSHGPRCFLPSGCPWFCTCRSSSAPTHRPKVCFVLQGVLLPSVVSPRMLHAGLLSCKMLLLCFLYSPGSRLSFRRTTRLSLCLPALDDHLVVWRGINKMQSGSNPSRQSVGSTEKPKMDPGVQPMSLGVCLSPPGGSAFFYVGFIPRKAFSHIKAKMAVASASSSSESVRKDPKQPSLGHTSVSY